MGALDAFLDLYGWCYFCTRRQLCGNPRPPVDARKGGKAGKGQPLVLNVAKLGLLLQRSIRTFVLR